MMWFFDTCCHVILPSVIMPSFIKPCVIMTSVIMHLKSSLNDYYYELKRIFFSYLVWHVLFCLSVIHKLHRQEFGFFWPPTPWFDIFYGMILTKSIIIPRVIMPSVIMPSLIMPRVVNILRQQDFGFFLTAYPPDLTFATAAPYPVRPARPRPYLNFEK